jgi:hypothetical protein
MSRAGGGVGVGWSSGRRHNEDAVRAAAQRRMGGEEPRKRRMRELRRRRQQLPATWRRRRARPCTGLGPGQGRILGGLNGAWWLSVVLILDWEWARRLRVVPHRLDLCALSRCTLPNLILYQQRISPPPAPNDQTVDLARSADEHWREINSSTEQAADLSRIAAPGARRAEREGTTTTPSVGRPSITGLVGLNTVHTHTAHTHHVVKSFESHT